MAQLDGHPAAPEDIAALALVNFGHFTSMRVERGTVRGLSLHLERLVRDCRTLFDAELDPDRVRFLARSALQGDPGPVTVRVTVYDPRLDLARPGASARPQILITTRPAPRMPLSSLRVTATRYVRPLAQVKHTGLFDTVRLRRQAQRAGFDDVLFTDDDTLCEGATWNIGFCDGEGVLWPAAAPALPGVTAALLDKTHERASSLPVHLEDLHNFTAAFATNAAVGVRAISQIDTVAFPDRHPVLRRLQDEYAAIPGEAL